MNVLKNVPRELGHAARESGNSMDDKFLAHILDVTGGRMAVSVSMVAQLLSISRPKAYELSRQTGFPAFSVGGRTLVSVAGLLEWVKDQAGSGM